MRSKKLYPQIIEIIIQFLGGKKFFFYRKELTNVSQALDLFYSNYANDSYWKWNHWRKRNGYDEISKPVLPKRLENFKSNSYIHSLDPPVIYKTPVDLYKIHQNLSRIIFK